MPPFLTSFLTCRYIDQCQELLDAPTIAERKDLDVYQIAVRTSTGDLNEWHDESPDEAFSTYVERGTTRYLDGSGRKEAFPIVFNYERWLGPLHKGS
jgi:phosphatidylinositol 3,5-bisphosphate 5-phosphatase